MSNSPLWLTLSNKSFHNHIVLNVPESFEDENLNFCRSLESFSRFISFGNVTEFYFDQQSLRSCTDKCNYPWHEVAIKVFIWSIAWVFIIPGIVFTLLKSSYLSTVINIAKKNFIQNLYSELDNAKQDNNLKTNFMIKMDIVAEKLRNISDCNRVVIKDLEDNFEVNASHDFIYCYLPEALVAHIDSDERQEENRATIQFLFRYFGEKRTTRLFNMMNVNIDYLKEHGLGLNRKQIAKFFNLTSFVHIEDMKDLLDNLYECKSKNCGYLYLSEDEVKNVVNLLGEKSFDELNKENYDILWNIMTSLRLSTMFIDKLEKVERDQNRGCHLDSIINSLWIEQNHLRFRQTKMSQREFDYTLMKSLVGHFQEKSHVSIKGKVVRQKKGYGFIRPMISAAGCYCIPMEAMGKTRRQNKLEEQNEEGKSREDTYLSRLLILPTQVFASSLPNSWESTTGVFQKNLGAKGVLAIWSKINTLFNEEPFKKVDIIGYSQGGTQAAKLGLLALADKNVRKIVKVCSPGEDAETSQLFAEIVERQQYDTNDTDYAIKITSIWQAKDLTQAGGDKEVSTDAVRGDLHRENKLVKQKIHWYKSSGEDQELEEQSLNKPVAPSSSISVMWHVVYSLARFHGEDSTLQENIIHRCSSTVKERNEVILHLDNQPLKWEPVRQCLADFIDRNSSSSYFADKARKITLSN
jgi:hypothetical protein